jgi:hypothetical protein
MNKLTQQLVMEEVRLRQARLGTPTERPEDFQVVRDLVHALNNCLEAWQSPPPQKSSV